MSIKNIAQRIINEAEETIKNFEGTGYTGFELHIGQRKIEVRTYSHVIKIKRWFEGEKNHHFYSVFTKGSWYSYSVSDKEREILKVGLKFAFQYLSEYAKWKKADGYILFQEKDCKVDDNVIELLNEVDETDFSEEEREHAAEVFTYYAEKYLVGSMTNKLKQFIKNAYFSALAVKEVVEEKPLCILGVSPYALMKASINITFHGEVITLYIGLDENDHHAVHVRFNNLGKECLLSYPLNKRDLVNILKQAEEDNKVKNLIKPQSHYFNQFIHNGFSFFDTNEIEREFNDIISNLNIDWTEIELMFKEALNRLDIHKEKIIESIVKYKESLSGSEINLSKVDLQSYSFCFVFYKTAGKYSNYQIRVFVTRCGENSNEAKEFVCDHLKNTLESKL